MWHCLNRIAHGDGECECGAYCGQGVVPDLKDIRMVMLGRVHVQGAVPGSVTWEVHERAWLEYAKYFGRDQSAERLAERGGFGDREIRCLLAGHNPARCRIVHTEEIPSWEKL